MTIRPIRTEEDYRAALAEVYDLLDAEAGTPECDRLEVLSILVHAYEEDNYPIPLPDPIEAMKYYMESRGLSIDELAALITERE